jgi:hypothetical protein
MQAGGDYDAGGIALPSNVPREFNLSTSTFPTFEQPKMANNSELSALLAVSDALAKVSATDHSAA